MGSRALKRPVEFAGGELSDLEQSRLLNLLHRSTLPPDCGEALEALVNGAAESSAALVAGMTPLEWKYMMYLGMSGHRTYSEYVIEVMKARGRAQVATQRKLRKRDDLASIQYELGVQGVPEALEVEKKRAAAAPSTTVVPVFMRQFGGDVVEGELVE